MTRMQHERDTSATRLLQEQHECDTSVTRVKNFDFDNDKSENVFSHSYVSYMANKRLQREEQFILKTTFWESFVPVPKFI